MIEAGQPWIPAEDATLADLVRDLAVEGERDALVTLHGEEAQTTSYAELNRLVVRLAAGLRAEGVGAGTVVLLVGPNGLDWVVVRLALGVLGALAVALDDLSSVEELVVLVPESGATHAFASAKHLAQLLDLPGADGRRHYLLAGLADEGQRSWRSLLAEAPAADLPALDAEAPQMLVYTSGTTGTPKSFTLSHRNVLHNVGAMAAQRVVTPDDRVLLPLPFHHVYPLTIGLLTALAARATLVLPEGVSGPQVTTALKVGRVTTLLAVPRLYQALADGIERQVRQAGWLPYKAFTLLRDLSKACTARGIRLGVPLFRGLRRRLAPDLWLMASGGARFEPALVWRLEALGWDVRSGWGLAETASVLTNNGPPGKAKKIGSEGRPLSGMQVRVGEPDEQGIGELQAKGPSIFEGYRNNPEANETAFTADGWFRTGDLGSIDEDGFVFIHGRVKEMIVLGGGKNVFPEEIEKVYAQNPLIEEIAVTEQSGNLVGLVRPNMAQVSAGSSGQVEPTIRAALGEAGQRLAPYQRLSGFVLIREPLPRTRLGKYQRFLLPDIYDRTKRGLAPRKAEALSAEDEALLARPPLGELYALLQERYPDKGVHPDASPQLDLGIDSLEWVNLGLEIEQRFGLSFSQEEVANVGSVRELLELAASHAESGEGRAPGDLNPSLTEADRRWLAPRTAGEKALGTVLYWLNRWLFRGPYRLKIEGEEHLRAVPEGPLLFVANHLSDLDPLVIAAALPKSQLERLRWSGERTRLFANGLLRAISRAARIFPVDERRPATTLAYGIETLERGDRLVWFPESWRSPDGGLQRFQSGVGHLLKRAPVAAMPVRISGTFEAMPRTASFPKVTPLRLVFGPVVPAAELADLEPADIALRLHEALAALPDRVQD